MKSGIFGMYSTFVPLAIFYLYSIDTNAFSIVKNQVELIQQDHSFGVLMNNEIHTDIRCALNLWSTPSNETVVRRNYRIVISLTFPYLPILLNWLLYYRDSCFSLHRLYFICLDQQSKLQLERIGLQCHHTHQVPKSGTHHRIWLVRGNIVHELLAAGNDVVLTDLDAIWLQNSLMTLNRFPQADIIASRASFPETVFNRIGATLCMGFVYFKSNAHVISLWEEVTVSMAKSKHSDDQRTVNLLIMNSGLKFSRGVKLNYARNFVDDHGGFTFRKMHFNLTLLSHSQFRRLCQPDSQPAVHEAIVAHCFIAGKGFASKQEELRRWGMWRLRDDWTAIDSRRTKPLSQYLSSIVNVTVVHKTL